MAPLPVNLDTINAVFGTRFERPEEAAAHLARVALPIAAPGNAAEYLYSRIGRELTDLLFRPYSWKMWRLELEDMDAAVVKRIPLRLDRNDSYFADDELQMLPRHGYTAIFERIFEHPGIAVATGQDFDPAMPAAYDFCFNSMPIDEYFDFSLGDLAYRSVKFHHRSIAAAGAARPAWSTTNFTDAKPYTRETRWDAMPHHLVADTGRLTATAEEPCDYRDNGMERYYPVRTADGRYQSLYQAYLKLAGAEAPKVNFIGRCGTYQYLDMDQVINQSLINARKHLALWA
jgi:UDP-galactopyranose mutase